MKFLATLVGAILAIGAQAAVVNFNFDTVWSGGNAPSGQIAHVKIEDFGADTIKFTVTGNWSTAVYGTTGKIGSVKFNLGGEPTSAAYVSGPEIQGFGDGGTDASLNFDFDVDYKTSNSNKFELGEVSVFTATRSGLDVGDITAPMMIHLQGITGYNQDSAKFTATPVPEPTSMAVLALGLAAAAKRRRKA